MTTQNNNVLVPVTDEELAACKDEIIAALSTPIPRLPLLNGNLVVRLIRTLEAERYQYQKLRDELQKAYDNAYKQESNLLKYQAALGWLARLTARYNYPSTMSIKDECGKKCQYCTSKEQEKCLEDWALGVAEGRKRCPPPKDRQAEGGSE